MYKSHDTDHMIQSHHMTIQDRAQDSTRDEHIQQTPHHIKSLNSYNKNHTSYYITS